ncbi:MAG: PilZ domain-containing protein [Phycisphaeraceae bacterium]|nr:PilZ domain-containing protein [Phycisphaeraceae bacterium]
MEQLRQEADRRRFRRTTVNRAGKVFVRNALRYLPVRAIDVSLGGLLLEVKSDRPLRVGEPIDVLIADSGRAILGPDDTVEARIAHVRLLPDGSQRVGLSFAREGAMAAVAA